MKRIFTLITMLIVANAFSQASKTLAPGQNVIAMQYAETIRQDDLKEDLTILASDALEGRETGKRGQKMAAAYIRAHYQEIGLEAPVTVGGAKSYYQDVELKKTKPGVGEHIYRKLIMTNVLVVGCVLKSAQKIV